MGEIDVKLYCSIMFVTGDLETPRFPAGPRRQALKVLVVEDREEDFRFLSMLLGRPQLGATYELDWADSFEAGIAKLGTGRYDAGLFDYSLGGSTGLDLLKNALSAGSEMPIIMLTGSDDPLVDEEALQTGASDYLCKVGLTSVLLERAIRYARRQADTLAELRRTHHLLNSVLSSLPVIAGRIDRDGTIQDARGMGLGVLGSDENSIVGVNILQRWPDLGPHLREALGGGRCEFTREVNTQGARHYFDNYLRFDEVRGHGAIGFAVDVTARVVAESERRREARLLQSILRSLPVIAGRLDAAGIVVEARGEGLARHRLAPAHILGRSLAEAFPQSRAAILDALAGGAASFTLGGRRKDEEWSVDFFVSFDSEQQNGATFFGRDLSERRRLEHLLLTASDAEQQRIGADLHDGLGQQLTGLACIAVALRDRLRVKLPAEADNADLISRLANEASEQSLALARGLSPVHLEAHGLASALEDLSFQSQRLHHIECRFSLRGPPPKIDHLASIHLYRIAQESIHNAVRHGAAQRVRIGLVSRGARHRLLVLDDGQGFDARLDQRRMGRGLCLMGYRANMLGGTLSISSALGLGSRILCEWNDASVAGSTPPLAPPAFSPSHL
jgi:signal transduction histidine kinase/CheY-like chemotaxis protein